MSNDPVSSNLPTLGAVISNWLGFQLPHISLPQTLKNIDKAFARTIGACGDNIASRLERDTQLRIARALAQSQVIEASGKHVAGELNGNNVLTERAIEYTFGKAFVEQQNREKIVRLAVEDVSEKSTHAQTDADSEIDDDWLNCFSEQASQKSHEQIQTLWAKILSGKIRNPKSFSLHSLHRLSALDANDAKLIHDILGYAISFDFIFRSSKVEEDLDRFMIGDDLGVLSSASSTVYRTFNFTKGTPNQFANMGPDRPGSQNIFVGPIELSDSVLFLWMPKIIMKIPCMKLTRFGTELMSLSEDLTTDREYENEFVAFLKNNGGAVKKAGRIDKKSGQAFDLYDL